MTQAKLTRDEAAALDMCLTPLISSSDWSTFKGQAADISAGARTRVSSQDAKAILNDLGKRRYLSQRRDELTVTDAGRTALMVSVGLGDAVAAQEAQLPQGLLNEIAGWFEKWLGDRLEQLLRNSSVPFPMPRRKAGALQIRPAVEQWNGQGRAWKLLASFKRSALRTGGWVDLRTAHMRSSR